MIVAAPEQWGTKETRVQLVFLDFLVWMVFLVTQGLLDPEANLVLMAVKA